jgi:hypothetical protein
MDEIIYLSRRNLVALLSKLDRLEAGEVTACTIIKHRNPNVPAYQQTMDTCKVVAVPDEVFYSAQQRPAGAMVEAEEVKLAKPSTGVQQPYEDRGPRWIEEFDDDGI